MLELCGRQIADVRPMTLEELAGEDWSMWSHEPPVVIELDDGTLIYASCGDEGNGPGTLFGRGPDDHKFCIAVS